MSDRRERPSGGPGEQQGVRADQGTRTRLTAWVSGQVQGVGFRWWVRVNALELGLAGSAENLVDGRVRIVAEGERASCAALLDMVAGRGAPGRVAHVTHRWDAARGGLAGFVAR